MLIPIILTLKINNRLSYGEDSAELFANDYALEFIRKNIKYTEPLQMINYIEVPQNMYQVQEQKTETESILNIALFAENEMELMQVFEKFKSDIFEIDQKGKYIFKFDLESVDDYGHNHYLYGEVSNFQDDLAKFKDV